MRGLSSGKLAGGSDEGAPAPVQGFADQERETGIAGFAEALSESVIGIDGGGRVVLANSRAIAMFGFGPGDECTIPAESLLPDLDSVEPGSCLLYTSPSPRDS